MAAEPTPLPDMQSGHVHVSLDDNCHASHEEIHLDRGPTRDQDVRVHWHHQGATKKPTDIHFDPNDSPFESVHHYQASAAKPHVTSDRLKKDVKLNYPYRYTLKTSAGGEDPTVIVDR